MKKLVLLTLGMLLSVNIAVLAEPAPADQKVAPADQKWLEVVQKLVAKGENKVSTPSESRVNLLKAWGKQNGYSVKVTKIDTGFRLEVTKLLAQK